MIPLLVISHRFTYIQGSGADALRDMDEYIIASIVGCDEAETPVLEEFLHSASSRYVQAMI